MNIHRGDKLETLVAFDTKSVNGLKLVQDKMGLDECANGDYTITLLRTANGKMIEIHHNVMTPRPYDRKYQLTGTEGFANKYPVEGFAFEPENISSDSDSPRGGRDSQEGRRPRRHGLRDGLPSGLLPAQRPAPRHGRL